MVITDISEPERRADALGKLGVSFAVGMIIGPVLGGQLVKHIGWAKVGDLVVSATVILHPANERWRYTVTPSLIG